MGKFVKKLIIFFIGVLVIAYVLQSLIDKDLRNRTTGIYKEWNDIIKSKINASILIQGSSRACFQISPYILDSSFNMNSYNLGIDGYEFHMQYYRFLLYLRYNKIPKYIIQSVDFYTLEKRPDLYKYSQFLPYLNIDIIREAVSSYQGLDWKDLYIPSYKYHGDLALAITWIESVFKKQIVSNNDRYKGFQAFDYTFDNSFRQFKEENPNGLRIIVDEQSQTLFNNYLSLCKAKNIKVIFVYSPEYIEAQKLWLNRDSITNIFKNYALIYNIPFLDYSHDSICLDTSYFYNSQHMNLNGVNKFNIKLVNDLKEIIK